MLEQIKTGKAYEKFLQLVKQQGGEITAIEDIEKLPKAKYIEPVYCEEEGYIQEINSKEIGKLAGMLGAGREKKEDKIDPAVGIVLNKKMAEKVQEKESVILEVIK